MSCPDTGRSPATPRAGLDAARPPRRCASTSTAARPAAAARDVGAHQPANPAHDLPWDVPLPGTLIGISRVTGTRSGGMGVAAYDPQTRSPGRAQGAATRPQHRVPRVKSKLRLVREAPAHGARTPRERGDGVSTWCSTASVFIAMELVEGQTLLRLVEPPRVKRFRRHPRSSSRQARPCGHRTPRHWCTATSNRQRAARRAR